MKPAVEPIPRMKISRAQKQQDIAREQIRRDQEFAEWFRGICRHGIYPLDSVGMPPPGPNFLRHAADLGDDSSGFKVQIEDTTKKSGYRQETHFRIGARLRKLYLRATREAGFTLPIEMRGGKQKDVSFVPGHIWSQYENNTDVFQVNAKAVDGPHPAKVMVLGKMPWEREVQALRNFMGPTGEILIDILRQFHVQGTPLWYVTNLCKFMPPDGTTTLKAAWLKDCLPILHQELRIVKPRYIMCLGADASKALLGSKFGVNYMEGRVIEYTYPTGLHPDDPRPHTALVMTVVHPAQVAR